MLEWLLVALMGLAALVTLVSLVVAYGIRMLRAARTGAIEALDGTLVSRREGPVRFWLLMLISVVIGGAATTLGLYVTWIFILEWLGAS